MTDEQKAALEPFIQAHKRLAGRMQADGTELCAFFVYTGRASSPEAVLCYEGPPPFPMWRGQLTSEHLRALAEAFK